MPLVIFDDSRLECDAIQTEIVRRRRRQLDPIVVAATFRDDSDKRVTDIGALLDYDQDQQRFIVQIEDRLYFMHRLNVQIEEVETKAAIEERRVTAMTLSKSVLLRMNVERILFEEVLRQRPEMRQPAHMTNSIEKFAGIERFRRQCRHPVQDRRIRELVA